MDFLDGDDVLTMSAAINLIDTVEIGESDLVENVTNSSALPNTEDDSSSSSSSLKPNAPPVRRKRKVKQGYSTTQARLKREELRDLRRQVEGLEEWLQHVKATNHSVEELSRNPGNTYFVPQRWGIRAMKEFQRLQDATHTNTQLKHALRTQKKLNAAILAILRRRNTLSGIDFVLNNPTRDTQANLYLDDTSVFMEQLSSRVSQLYHDCAAVFPKERLPTFGCRMEPTVDMYRGRMMEIVARAPVDCPMKQASDILWEELSTLRTYPDKSYRYMTAKGADAMTKGFDMTLRSRFGTTAVNGLQYMQRFEEAERVVQVRAYKLLLPTEGLHLRGHAWTIVSQSETDPVHQSDVQFYLQLFVETQEGFSAREKDVKYIEEIGLDAWSSKMRWYSVWLQDMVVEKAKGKSVPTVV